MSEENDNQNSSLSENSSDDDESKEPGPSVAVNPFFDKSKRQKLKSEKSENSEKDSDDSDFSDSSDDEDSDLSEKEDSDAEKVPEPEIDEEDPLIKALKKSKEKSERKSPPDITCTDLITDFSFHPGSNLVAHCDINGKIYLNEYTNEENVFKNKQKCHKGNVRSLEFDPTGSTIFSGGEDKSFQIIDTETFKTVLKISDAHDAALYKIKPINENLLVTGDEDGTVKLWDKRQSSNMTKSVMEDSESLDDAVTDFFHKNQDPNYLVASSAEGVIQGYNLAGKKADVQSEVYEGEMNAMAVVHRDSKLIVGSGNGRLYMFNWREFGHWSDQFPGHPNAINSIVAVTDNVVITACEDGVIRAVHLYPHRFVGTVGHHEKGFGVEKLDVSHDGSLIASISHDECVKFWSIKYLEEMDYNKTKKPFLQQKGQKMRRKDNKMNRAQESEYQLPSSKKGNAKDFFKDLDE